MPMRLFLLLLAAASLNASAAPWSREPATVMGIHLGERLEASALPDCSSAETPSDAICLTTKHAGSTDIYRLERTPFDGASVSLMLDDEKNVGTIFLNGPRYAFNNYINLLTARYGPPTKTQTQSWQAANGAHFPSKEFSWTGRLIKIYASERVGDPEDSAISFTSIKSEHNAQQKGAANTKAAASKL